MKEIRIIVAGGRDFDDYDLLHTAVEKHFRKLMDDNILKVYYQIEIISGCARGADRLGEIFADKHEFDVRRFPADWNKYGKRAGYIRNAEMAKYAVADGSYGVLFAFWDGKSRGTKNMIETAEKYGLEVNVIMY